MRVIWETRALFLNFWKASFRASEGEAVRAARRAVTGARVPGGAGRGRLSGTRTVTLPSRCCREIRDGRHLHFISASAFPPGWPGTGSFGSLVSDARAWEALVPTSSAKARESPTPTPRPAAASEAAGRCPSDLPHVRDHPWPSRMASPL